MPKISKLAETAEDTLGGFGVSVAVEDLREKVDAMDGKLDTIAGHLEAVQATLDDVVGRLGDARKAS